MVENQQAIQSTMDATVDVSVHAGEDAVTENNRIQPDPDSVGPEHFGTFDSNMSLYSGFDDVVHTSPRLLVPSQTINDTLTPSIPTACPSEFDDGAASCQSMVILLILNSSKKQLL